MSIQPNRVILRIVEQVDRSDWPPLLSRVLTSQAGDESIRFYRERRNERYATPLHFWVHALREELSAVGQRDHLVGAAGHAMGRNQTRSDWLREFETFVTREGPTAAEILSLTRVAPSDSRLAIYRMLESSCRRSTVVDDGETLMAHFWGHGSNASWQRSSIC